MISVAAYAPACGRQLAGTACVQRNLALQHVGDTAAIDHACPQPCVGFWQVTATLSLRISDQ